MSNEPSLIRIRKLRPLIVDDAQWIADHQDNYPEAMREDDAEEWTDLIEKGNGLSVGCFDGDQLLAWSIVTAEEPESPVQVYWYDLSCLREFQGEGLAKAVMADTYRRLRWSGKWVRMHCRAATYPRDGASITGFKVVRDIFVPHHYLTEYGVDEDAHELLLAPT